MSDVFSQRASYDAFESRQDAKDERELHNQTLHNLNLSVQVINKTKAERDFFQKQLNDAKKKIEELQDSEEHYTKLLTIPMMELAKKTGKFAQTYLLQQETMARWILTQRSWKKLAIDGMKSRGMSDEEIEKEFEETKKEIIDDVGENNGRVKFFKEKLLEENK